jgi:outer membrane protein assembly factor BamB/tetratricopeptide (TPR) repeat protein
MGWHPLLVGRLVDVAVLSGRHNLNGVEIFSRPIRKRLPMRTLGFRLAIFTALPTVLGLAILSGPDRLTAQPVFAQPVTDAPGAKEAVIEKLSFPESRDTNRKFEAVQEYLAQMNPKWREVSELAQGLLDAKSDYFYQYPDGDKRRVSVKDEISRIIGKLPKEGQDFYQITYGPIAEGMLKDAKENGYDRSKLAEISQRYFHTKAGADATLLLATLNLEAGNFPEAAYGYQRLFARPNSDPDPKTLFRTAMAVRRSGDGKMTDTVATIWSQLEKKFPRDGLQIGRKAYSLETLKAELDKPVEMLFGSVGDQFVSMKGGNPTRTAQAEAGTPFLGTIFSLPVLYRVDDDQKAGFNFVSKSIEETYRQSKTNKTIPPMIPAVFPVTAPNMILFRGYDGVYAFYTRDFIDSAGKQHIAGELAWHQMGKYGAASIESGSSSEESTNADLTKQKEWWAYWSSAQPSILFENPLAGSLSHDGKRAYFVDDFHIPPSAMVMNQDGGFGGPMPASSRGGKQEHNRLISIDLESGALIWSIGRSGSGLRGEEVDKATNASALGEGAYFLGPPITLGGKLYVLLERDGFLLMACLDGNKLSDPIPKNGKPAGGVAMPKQPELVWVQNLGRANTPIGQDPLRRVQGAFLAAADGVIICPTNSGAIVAVDLNARSLLWAHTYATANAGNTNPQDAAGGFRRRGGPVVQNNLGPNRWRSSTPMIANGRVVISAYDSGTVQCLDLRTGKLHWQENRKNDDLYIGGILQDNVLVVSRNSIRAIKLIGDKEEKTGREKAVSAWGEEVKIALPIGHGVAGKDGHFYIPVLGDLDNPDDQTAAVWDINTATRKIAKTPYRRKDVGSIKPTADPRMALGNLVFHDGMMFSQSATDLVAFPLNETKQREMDAVLAKNPNDPDGLYSRGELKLERGELQAAVADFKLAQANKPTDVTGYKIKQKLYIAYTEILRDRFADGESFLPEYKQLCEFAVDPDAPDHGRQNEEQIRRRGLYFSLVASGREAQGRLVEAFDNYRAYAELGEKGKLLPVPEDPNTSALSTVWASGRIDAMMKATKDNATRKPLEDRVSKDWAEVREANDLNRLRKFVTVFGPYFEAGREAQFLLAEKLTSTNNDDDRREAQSILLTLLAIAEDDKNSAMAARATAATARLLTSRGLLDDALGLYSRLAGKYPDITIQNGKTGADLLGELITDKQYWPALEPERPVTLNAYTAKADASNNTYRSSSLGLTPDGELLPFYKRHRISLDSDMNSGTPPRLKVIDRISGQEKFTASVGGLPFQNWGYVAGNPNASVANARLAQVSGHLMLLHYGQNVICYDLSRSVELWKIDIAAQNGTRNNQNMNLNLSLTTDATGELIAQMTWYNQFTGQSNTDWQFRMGRSAVLQANYAAVLTKDGLIMKDPRTGDLLWQRTGLAQSSLIFGDARYVYLIEPTQTGFVSRVLRAVDGVQVPGVPEFGTLFAGSSRVQVFGRQILVFDTGGKEKPRTMRLYDILDGKDVWTKQFPGESIVFETIDPDITGVVSPDGKMTVLTSRNGQVLFEGQVEKSRLKEHLQDEKGKFAIVKPLLLADANRFYMFLNRDQNKLNQNGQVPENYGASPNRVRVVNGSAYAFDRSSKERLWYTSSQFANQRLLIERFDELPCLIAFNPMHYDPAEMNPPGGGAGGVAPGRVPAQPGVSHRVVVLDKKTGMLKENKNLAAGSGWFQWMSFDKATGSFEIGGSNNGNGGGRLKISPAEVKK